MQEIGLEPIHISSTKTNLPKDFRSLRRFELSWIGSIILTLLSLLCGLFYYLKILGCLFFGLCDLQKFVQFVGFLVLVLLKIFELTVNLCKADSGFV